MIREIEIQICETEETALLTEKALIRDHKPEFNHAKKSPETYYYLTLHPGKACYPFRLTMRLPEDQDLRYYTYGAFKGHRTVRKGCGALLRQLYLLDRHVHVPFEFPSSLMKNLTPLQYELSYWSDLLSSDKLKYTLQSYFNGESLQFLEMLIKIIHDRGLMETYIARLILKDCESLRKFFDYCLQPNYKVKEKLGLEGSIISQEKLDDCLIRLAFVDT